MFCAPENFKVKGMTQFQTFTLTNKEQQKISTSKSVGRIFYKMVHITCK